MRFILPLAFCLSLSASLLEAATWYQHYAKGKQAIESSNWAEAIDNLEQAIQKKGEPCRSCRAEGLTRIDYFPQYYLGIAHQGAGHNDLARGRLNEALSLGLLTPDLEADARGRLKALSLPALDPQFDPLARAGAAAAAANRFDDAVAQLERAQRLEPGEFQKRGLDSKLRQARAGLQATTWAGEALTLLQSGRLNQARSRLQQAEALFPGLKAVVDAMAAIQRREDRYKAAKNTGDQAFDQRDWSTAKASYQEARAAYPEQFGADGLESKLASIPAPTDDSLFQNGVQAFQQGRFTQALNDLNAFLSTQPQHAEARSYRDRAWSMTLLDEGRDLARRSLYSEAELKYVEAVRKDSNNEQASKALNDSRAFAKLIADARRSLQQNDTSGAQSAYRQARSLDPTRYRRGGLPDPDTLSTAGVDDTTPDQAAPDTDTAVRRALETLLKDGDVEDAVIQLEELRGNGLEANPTVHAYLGVAYATLERLSPKLDEQKKWRLKAVEEFKKAISLKKDYRLSETLVSPAIVKLFLETQQIR